jgi:large subunit ribosomal protein L23
MGILNKFGKKKGGAAEPEKKSKKEAAPAAEGKAEKKEKVEEISVDLLGGETVPQKEGSGTSYRILLKPVYTEKSTRLQGMGKYVFMVAPDTNKIEVMRAIRDLYGVAPVSVRIIKEKGNVVRFGKTMGREKDEKKAIVTLKPGETLNVVEGA